MKKSILISLLAIIAMTIFWGCSHEKKEAQVINVLIPKTPSGIPVYLALKDKPQYKVKFFLNHSQANAKFLRGDAKLLLTGISVANSFAKQDVDFKVACSVVDNLTFLVGNKKVTDINDIKGETVVFPFADSPMEQMFTSLTKMYDMVPGTDYKVKYLPITSSVELLKQGSEELVFLPEPFVTIATSKLGLKLGLSLNNYFTFLNKNAHASQVVLLARDIPQESIKELSSEIENNVQLLITGKLELNQLASYPNFEKFNIDTFKRTSYYYSHGKELKDNLQRLFEIIEKDNNLADHILELH